MTTVLFILDVRSSLYQSCVTIILHFYRYAHQATSMIRTGQVEREGLAYLPKIVLVIIQFKNTLSKPLADDGKWMSTTTELSFKCPSAEGSFPIHGTCSGDYFVCTAGFPSLQVERSFSHSYIKKGNRNIQ